MKLSTNSDAPYMRKIDYVFFNEAQIREAVIESKNKMIYSEIKNPSAISDPTAATALRNLMPVEYVKIDAQLLRKPEEWLEVIDNTKRWCRERGETYYRILRGQYLGEKISRLCEEIGISADYFYRTLNKIRNYAALWAAWFHLVAF